MAVPKPLHIAIIMLLTIALSTTQHAFSQIILDDLKSINNAYAANSEFSMDIVYSTVAQNGGEKILEKDDGFARKKGDFLHVKMGQVETIKSSNLVITLDHKNKFLIISESVETNNVLTHVMTANIEKVLDYSSNIEYKKIDSDFSKYILNFSKGSYKQMEFTFNKKTSILSELVVFASETKSTKNPNDKVEESNNVKYVIQYNNINLQPQFAADEFTTWKYIYKNGNEFIAAEKFINYKIINQIPAK